MRKSRDRNFWSASPVLHERRAAYGRYRLAPDEAVAVSTACARDVFLALCGLASDPQFPVKS